MTAANADAQNPDAPADTIVLPAGAYATPNGVLDIHGNLQIIGEGPEQTLVETRHLDRLFEVDGGSLQLTDLTIDGGSESTLLTSARKPEQLHDKRYRYCSHRGRPHGS